MLPTVGSDSSKIISYAAEVSGRVEGIAAGSALVPDATKRTALERSATRLATGARELLAAFVARTTTEMFEQRRVVGHGRGIDRGFDAGVATIAESLRTSLPDRTTTSPEYRAVFSTGSTDPFTSPTIKQDPELASDLRQRITDSGSSAKVQMLSVIEALIPLVGPAAAALTTGESAIQTQWDAELLARKKIVDALWEEKRAVEQSLGRSGRGLARFAFFDFSEPGTPSSDTKTDPGVPPVAG